MNNSQVLTDGPSRKRLPSAAAFTQAVRQRIGERVRTARIAAHLTQMELAGQEYSKSYLSAVERGRMTPSFHALGLLAERLGVTRSYLLGEDLPAPCLPPTDLPVTADQQTAVRESLELLLEQERYAEALALCAESGRLEWMSEVRAAYAQCLATHGRYEEAYGQIVQAFQEPARER